MKPKFFRTQERFRKWLRENHDKRDELVVGYYKVKSGKRSMTWPESVDQALCFGWIDGIRRTIDEESYSIRFTPRRPGSNWSKVNLKKVEKLKKAGLMREPGLAAYEKRTEDQTEIYGYETRALKLSPEFRKRFKENEQAWSHFRNQTLYVRKISENWVMCAKREDTRERRFLKLVSACAAGERLR